jgi:hypothetical protein
LVAHLGGIYYIFENGVWSGSEPRVVDMLNDALRHAPLPDGHPHPDRYVLVQARKAYPGFSNFLIERPKNPEDRATHWLQCLFEPGTLLLPLHRLFPEWISDGTDKSD